MSSKKSRGGVTKSQTFAAGCVASAVAETTTHPLDFVKTHLQLQRTNGGQQQLGVVGKAGLQAAPRPQGFRQMFSKVMREDGVSGFYKGLPPALARQMVNSGFSLFLYRPIREALSKTSYFKREDGGEVRLALWWKIGIAAVGSATGQLISTPFDVMKVRLQADGHRKAMGEPPLYRNMLHVWGKTIKGEGVRGLWSGWLPGVQRSAIVGGVGISLYDQTKDWLEERGVGRGSLGGQVFASFVSGVCCALVSVPLEVVKVRMMASGVEGGGVVRMMAGIAKKEGPLALYKGFVPTYVRMAPWQFVFFVTMEKILACLSGEWF